VARRETLLVVGASLTGATAAATLRDRGFDGRVVVIGDEANAPYERPELSKAYLRGERPVDDLFVRPAGWWDAEDIELRLGCRVDALDVAAGSVTLEGGEELRFDLALVATGVRNRKLAVPGAELDRIFQLRTIADADRIRSAAAGASSAVVVGMGFIGAEVTASLRGLGVAVTVVEIFETALYRVLGPTIGRVIEAVHRDHGVDLIFGETVDRIVGDGRVEAVVTRGGRTIAADLVVVGVGTEPNVELLDGSGLDTTHGVAVDAGLRTSAPRVFAAGDVATQDHPVFGPTRVEHFDNALKMGAHAAASMLDDVKPFDDPHWFWSEQYDSRVEMAGVSVGGEMVLRGSLEDRSFCAFFLEGGIVRAAVSLDHPRDVRRALPLIREEAAPAPDRLRDPAVDLRELVKAGTL
jgi:3-phenylpropionate/trans-cinnamate dioxygenase ferredoxin reductase component